MKSVSRAWCKTIVTMLFYITSYNSFAPSPNMEPKNGDNNLGFAQYADKHMKSVCSLKMRSTARQPTHGLQSAR